MRMSELLNREVLDPDGRSHGRVHDVRLVQDGPPTQPFGTAALRLESLLIGPVAIGVRLGFDRRDLRGPWPLKALFSRLHRGLRAARWNQIRAIESERIQLRARADELVRAAVEPHSTGRIRDAGLELLDRQLVDRSGLLAGNVDDLLFVLPAGGGPPVLSAILSGPGALADRIGGRWGHAIATAHRRLSGVGDGDRGGIPFSVVTRIGTDLELGVDREGLESMRSEAWVRDHVVARIPGAS